ncbi:MAG: bifunctional GrpB family protein/GNAT family N-acetyltransferase [Chloroflexota bacterium]
MKRQVILSPHNPAWKQAFRAEMAHLTPIFGDNLVDIHHIGSTAVSGIKAKPTIDMLPIVWDIQQVDNLKEAMAAAGYIHRGEHGVPGRRYFRKGSDAEHTHHIHTFQVGSPEIARHLLFRDYLRTRSTKARDYDRLKTQLAQVYQDDPAAYTHAKTEFILAIEREAFTWQRERERPLCTLTTPRLQLIALSIEQLYSFRQDPSLLAASLNLPLTADITHPVVHQAVSIKLSKMRLADATHHPWYTYWLIVRCDENLGIGTVGFKGEPDLRGRVEIGYGLSSSHRNHGFMTEAVQSLIAWAFTRPNCITVFAHTDPANIPSHRVLEKIGMKRTGEINDEWRWEMNGEE